MKILFIVARFLLGLIFLVFGLNGLLHFIPMSLPEGVAGQFFGVLFTSHYLVFVFLLQLIGGLLLLIGRYVPLALTLLAPVIVNILLFHLLMAPSGFGLALVVIVLWAVVAYQNRAAFRGLFEATV